MLRKCPECELNVSDKAIMCPHCGYPLKNEEVKKMYKKPNRRKRLPNGFGQISEIKNRNLRNPFRVMIPMGKDEYGRPISKLLKPKAYFPTYNDAYMALVEHHRNPYDIEKDITFEELYERWADKHFKNIGRSMSNNYESSYKYCSTIYKMKVKDLRIKHLRGCLEEGYIIYRNNKKFATPARQKFIKSMFNQLLDYALECEIVDKNIAREFNFKIDTETKNTHIIYTKEEMDLMWENMDTIEDLDIVIIQCYSGWRPSELLNLKVENIDIGNWTFTGGSKTKAGKNRIVPIHTIIRPLVVNRYEKAIENNSDLLFTYHGRPYKYNQFLKNLTKIKDMLSLNPDHKPHDGRKHFVTMAKKYKVDDFAIKYIVGHAIYDITEKVYTERNIDWMKAEIEKIEK